MAIVVLSTDCATAKLGRKMLKMINSRNDIIDLAVDGDNKYAKNKILAMFYMVLRRISRTLLVHSTRNLQKCSINDVKMGLQYRKITSENTLRRF